MGNLARRAGRSGLHFIICGMRMQLDDLSRPIAANRYGLSMDVESAGQAPFYANVPRSYSKMELPRGRGFLIYPGRMMLLQIAQPYEDEITKMEAMDEQVTAIVAKYGETHVQWRDWAIREDEEADETGDGAVSSGNGQPTSTEPEEELPYTAEQIADIRRALAETMGMDEESLKMIDDDGIIEMAERYNLLSEEEL
jgi:hypothetical protein